VGLLAVVVLFESVGVLWLLHGAESVVDDFDDVAVREEVFDELEFVADGGSQVSLPMRMS
jgi:hypothetical protein